MVWPADRPGTYVPLSVSTNRSVRGTDIDEEGNVLGRYTDVWSGTVLWTEDGTYRELPGVRPDAGTWPVGFHSGRILGDGPESIVEWDFTGTLRATYPRDLGLAAVNATGLAVGYRDGSAVLWRDGVIVRRLPAMGVGVRPVAITAGGTVAGYRVDDSSRPVYGSCVHFERHPVGVAGSSGR